MFLSIFNYYYNYYHLLIFEFFTPQISRTLLSILANVNNPVAWRISTFIIIVIIRYLKSYNLQIVVIG